MLPTFEELGIGFVPYSPLGRGFLTGKVDEHDLRQQPDFRNIVPRFTPEARKANRPLVDLLGGSHERKKATPAQIALAWLLAQKPWIVPIPGTRSWNVWRRTSERLQIELTFGDLREIENAFSEIKVSGARLSEEHMELIDR